MELQKKIDFGVFKLVFRAMAESDDLEIMANHFAQLLVATLDIKGSAIFVLNPQTSELEHLASFGLSMNYLHKGPVKRDRSLAESIHGKPTVIRDTQESDRLQYPEDAKKEGIRAIVSIPIRFADKVIGALRLYHREVWDIPEEDLDSLMVLAEGLGLAMTYTRTASALKTIRQTVLDLHGVWMMEPE
ncbi:MAG: GAF domain-containing protein [Desulfobacterales bacterium]